MTHRIVLDREPRCVALRRRRLPVAGGHYNIAY